MGSDDGVSTDVQKIKSPPKSPRALNIRIKSQGLSQGPSQRPSQKPSQRPSQGPIYELSQASATKNSEQADFIGTEQEHTLYTNNAETQEFSQSKYEVSRYEVAKSNL